MNNTLLVPVGTSETSGNQSETATEKSRQKNFRVKPHIELEMETEATGTKLVETS